MTENPRYVEYAKEALILVRRCMAPVDDGSRCLRIDCTSHEAPARAARSEAMNEQTETRAPAFVKFTRSSSAKDGQPDGYEVSASSLATREDIAIAMEFATQLRLMALKVVSPEPPEPHWSDDQNADLRSKRVDGAPKPETVEETPDEMRRRDQAVDATIERLGFKGEVS